MKLSCHGQDGRNPPQEHLRMTENFPGLSGPRNSVTDRLIAPRMYVINPMTETFRVVTFLPTHIAASWPLAFNYDTRKLSHGIYVYSFYRNTYLFLRF